MNNAVQVKQRLIELVESTSSPVYIVCSEIFSYLVRHPKHSNLTIIEIRDALDMTSSDDNVLIQAAFALTSHPFQALDVRYRLCDENFEYVIEELDHSAYMRALTDGYFIDNHDNRLVTKEFCSRVFPYFINLCPEYNDVVAEPYAVELHAGVAARFGR
jgi:hypothetical protein